MIKRFNKISDFGIFQNFVATADLQEFCKFNLFYGWNGSGKSTLSSLFNLLETKTSSENFPNSDFEISIFDSTKIKHKTLSSFKEKVSVFNQDFINNNIDWKNQGAKSIVVISEGKKIERERYFDLKSNLIPQQNADINQANLIFTASEKERDSFLSEQAKSLKQSFQLIDTSDSHYFNYNKTKLETFINQHKPEILNPKSKLSTDELVSLHQKVKPIEKSHISFQFNTYRLEHLKQAYDRITLLINESIVNNSIERLKQNDDINSWVQLGIDLHQKHQSKNCEFCGQELQEKKITDLENHFNKSYLDLIKKLNDAIIWLNSIDGYKINNLPEQGIFYDEFIEEYLLLKAEVIVHANNVAEIITSWIDAISNKIKNPFNNSRAILPINEAIAKLIIIQDNISTLILKHNAKSANFEYELQGFKHKLELHYVTDNIIEKNFFSLQDRIVAEKSNLDAKKIELSRLEDEFNKLEALLSNATIGADNFNLLLHSFLGRKDISLAYDTIQKGYKIERTDSKKPAKNLSEGEKTAISFIYFIIKLTENGNKIEDSIIVIDDPVSSLDSNHLFHSYAFLKNHCEKAKQLFVLTHNFQFFKLMRDWLLKKNKKDAVPKSAAFSIEIEKGEIRKSKISNAHKSLLDYGSEYHFLFKKLYEYKSDTELNSHNSYQVANFGRKILESFFTFKHPKGRDNFKQLFDDGCKEAKIENLLGEKVYRFINKYSHNQTIEFHDSPVDNLLGESENITNNLFNIIEKADAIHYKEMEELCLN